MTSQTLPETQRRPAPRPLIWGVKDSASPHLQVEAWRFTDATAAGSLPGYRAGPATSRDSQPDIIKAVIGANLGGGLQPRSDIAFWQSNALRSYVRNEGIQTRGGALEVPWPPVPPFALTTQASVTNDENSSGFNAANTKIHGVASALGDTGYRFYAGLGTRFWRSTSTSNSAQVVASCNVDGAGASVTLPGRAVSIAEGLAPGNGGLAVYMDLEDYGLVYTEDPTASPVVWTTAVAHANSGDRIDVLDFDETIFGGVLKMVGKVGGVSGHFWHKTSDSSVPWTVESAIESGTQEEEATQTELQVSSIVLASAGANDASEGDNAWSDAGNITASDDVDATATTPNTTTSTQYLVASFAALQSTDSIPDEAIIEGFVVRVLAGAANGNLHTLTAELRLSGTRIGVSKNHPDATFGDNETQSYGSLHDSWGDTGLHGSDLANVEFAIRYWNAASACAIDSISMQVAYRLPGIERTWLGPKLPTVFSSDDGSFDWDNPLNVYTAGDGNFAINNATGVPLTTADALWGGFFQRGEVPDDAIVEEVIFDIVRQTDDASIDLAGDTVAQLWLDGAAIGTNVAFTAVDWGNDDENQRMSYRFAFDPNISGNIQGSDLPRLFFDWQVTAANASVGDLRIDYLACYVSYRQSKGSRVSTTTGGYGIGHASDEVGVTYHIAPRVDDPDGITQPRFLYKVTWTPLSDGRIVITRTPIATGLFNVHDVNFKLGGVQVVGDHAGGPGRLLLTLASNGRLLDSKFYAVHGTQEVRLNAITHVQGIYSVLDVVDSDFGDRQCWVERDGVPYPDTVLQSKNATTISAQPITWAEKAIDLSNDRIYSFFPNGTDTAVARQFIPRNLSENPRLTNLSEGKETQELRVFLGDIDFGPPEANKMLSQLHLQTREVDDGTTYGTVHVLAETDGTAPTGTGDALDVDFATAPTDADFGETDIAAALRYRSLYFALGLSSASATKFATLGPLVIVTEQDWEALEAITFEVDRRSVDGCEYTTGGVTYHGEDAWREFANDGLVRPLSFGQERGGKLWRFAGFRDGPMTSMPAMGARDNYTLSAARLMNFVQVPGSAS